MFLDAILETYLALFTIDGVYDKGRYSFESAGVQGRYLIPFCLAGLLLLKQKKITVTSRVLQPVVLCVSTAYAALSLAVVVSAFNS